MTDCNASASTLRPATFRATPEKDPAKMGDRWAADTASDEDLIRLGLLNPPSADSLFPEHISVPPPSLPAAREEGSGEESARCKADDCDFFGSPAHRGLCSGCFNRLHIGESLQALLDDNTLPLGDDGGKWALAAVARAEQDGLRFEDLRVKNRSGGSDEGEDVSAEATVPLSMVTCVLALRNRMELRPIRARVRGDASLVDLFRAVAGQALAMEEEEEADRKAVFGEEVFGHDTGRIPRSPWTFTDAELRRLFYDEPAPSGADPVPDPSERVHMRFRRVAFRRNGTKRPDNAFLGKDYARSIRELSIEKLKRSIYLEQQEQANFEALESATVSRNILLSLRWWDDENQRASSLGDVVIRNSMTIGELKQHLSNVVKLAPAELVVVEQETPEVFNVARDDDATLEALELINGDILVLEKLDPPFHMNSKGLQIHRERVCYACHAGPPIVGELWRCTECVPEKLLCGRCNDLKRHSDHEMELVEAPKSELDNEGKAIRTKTGEHYIRVRRRKQVGQAECARVALQLKDAPAWSPMWHYRLPRSLRDQIAVMVKVFALGKTPFVVLAGRDILFKLIAELVTASLSRFAGLAEANRCTRVVHHVDTSLNDHNDDSVAKLVLTGRVLSLPPTCRPPLCVWQRGKAPARTPAFGLHVDSKDFIAAFPDNGTNSVSVVSLRNGRTLLKVPEVHNRRRGSGLLPRSSSCENPRLLVCNDHILRFYELSPAVLEPGHKAMYIETTGSEDDNDEAEIHLFEEDELRDRDYDEEYFSALTFPPTTSSFDEPCTIVSIRDIFRDELCPLEELSEKCLLSFFDPELGVDRVFICNCPRNKRDDCVMELRAVTNSDTKNPAHGGWELVSILGRGVLEAPTSMAVDPLRRRLIVGQPLQPAVIFNLDTLELCEDLTARVYDAQHLAVDPVSGHLVATFANASAVATYPILGPGCTPLDVPRVMLTGDDALERPVGVAFCSPVAGGEASDPRMYVLDAEFEGLRIVAL
jgi:ICP0-binding domain of Ubiquitin-specific protease 7/A20-like zinc finger